MHHVESTSVAELRLNHPAEKRRVSIAVSAATLTTGHRADVVCALPVLAHEPLQDMRRVPAVTARLTEHERIINGIFKVSPFSNSTPACETATCIPFECVCASSAFLVESCTMLSVIRQIEHRVLSRAEETGMVAMLTENEVCYAAFLYANGLLNATKSLSVTEWPTFIAKGHYEHFTLSSKLFKGNLYVICTIPL